VNLEQVPSAQDRITRADVEHFLSAPAADQGQSTAAEFPSAPTSQRAYASPAARRLAHEQGLDLHSLHGSGPGGRIQGEDVRALMQQKQASPTRAERPAQVQPLEGMRRVIAERMQASFQEAPHIALSMEVDISRLEEARRRLNDLAGRRGESKVTLTAWMVKITAWALEQAPILNASLLEGQIYQWNDINIGVAVGVPNGLIVPVIRQANQKGIHEISAALEDLTQRARAGKLALADVHQGTFTISNLGMFGIHHFRAVINPPESGILAVGAAVRKPVVINEQDEIAVRPMMNLTLSADHRLVDGIAAARFLASVVQAVECPDILLY
jgi:pyruvate dehydrogenase E2 component (dihydrolipoamide acetyltransferase)